MTPLTEFLTLPVNYLAWLPQIRGFLLWLIRNQRTGVQLRGLMVPPPLLN